MVSIPELRATWLGRHGFASALELQLDAREELIAGTGSARLFLVEHPPTLTLGRRGRSQHVLWNQEQLRSGGIEVCETPRGGEVTLHAPGQLVAYPVIFVGRAIRAHVVRLAQTTIDALAVHGLNGLVYRQEHPGVWRMDDGGERKLASIGVHLSRGVTVQGIGINLDVDAALFGALISCGFDREVMVSASKWLGTSTPSVETFAVDWARVFAADLGMELVWTPPNEPARLPAPA